MQRSLEDLREKIELKEKTSQNFLSKLRERKEKKFIKQKNKAKQRQEQIIYNLIKVQEQKEKSRQIYLDKQLYLEQTAFLKTMKRRKKIKSNKIKYLNFYSFTLENKKKIERVNLKKNAMTLRKLELYEKRVKDNQKRNKSI